MERILSLLSYISTIVSSKFTPCTKSEPMSSQLKMQQDRQGPPLIAKCLKYQFPTNARSPVPCHFFVHSNMIPTGATKRTLQILLTKSVSTPRKTSFPACAASLHYSSASQHHDKTSNCRHPRLLPIPIPFNTRGVHNIPSCYMGVLGNGREYHGKLGC
ncbi:hypothetical protein EDC01DRAFT_105276 [Geopyxis carbonaria]|nr:hypothetical protein EDC01DRAFT_105276 [Geopyxis carbonaria]